VVCTPPQRLQAIAPDAALADAYTAQFARYRALYPALKGALS
jgi:xylulokinase